jgi:hypothetical protein
MHNQTLAARYRDYKRNAGTRGLVFNMNKDEFDAETQKTCVFCGAEDHVGIDRIDSSMGYVTGNIQPCCSFCNKMKSNYGEEAFLSQIAKIYRHTCKEA